MVMEPQHPPLKIARFTDFGIGLSNMESDSWTMASNTNTNSNISRLSTADGEEEGSLPPIALALELGCGGSGHRPTTAAGFTKSSCGFTVFQLQELQLQSLIYKYMEAGLPVPHHLLLPIWKSLAASLTTLTATPYQLYSGSGFLGFGALRLAEQKNGMDPEPGRCRRTDGKKWRCSKEAVPNHKYCERHMHRGRQRSRKHVEVAPSQSTPTTTTTTTTTGIIRRTTTATNNNADTNLSISLQLDTTSSSSNSNGSNFSSTFIGFSPKSVLPLAGVNPKPEPVTDIGIPFCL